MDTMVKSIFLSKTFWLNLLGPGFAILSARGLQLDPATQDAIVVIVMAVANIVMRRFTNSPVAVTAPLVKVTPPGGTASVFLAGLLCLSLTGCPAPPSPAETSVAIDGCMADGLAIQTLAIARKAGRLSPAIIALVDKDIKLADPVCGAHSAQAAMSAAQSAAIAELFQLAAKYV